MSSASAGASRTLGIGMPRNSLASGLSWDRCHLDELGPSWPDILDMWDANIVVSLLPTPSPHTQDDIDSIKMFHLWRGQLSWWLYSSFSRFWNGHIHIESLFTLLWRMAHLSAVCPESYDCCINSCCTFIGDLDIVIRKRTMPNRIGYSPLIGRTRRKVEG